MIRITRELALAVALLLLTPLSAQALGRDGTYFLSPNVSYACAFGGPASWSFSSVDVVDTDPAISFTPTSGTPATMSGPISEPTFDVQTVEPGSCTVTHSISGTFTTADAFDATYSITFIGASCSVAGCVDQTIPILGSRLGVPVPGLPATPLVVGLILLSMVALASRKLSST